MKSILISSALELIKMGTYQNTTTKYEIYLVIHIIMAIFTSFIQNFNETKIVLPNFAF